MTERPPSIDRAAKLAASWRKGPFVLASGSVAKLASLQQSGFEQATGLATPDEIEDARFEEFADKAGEGRIDEMAAALIAKVKVAYALEHGASEDALVCAFDTIPLLARRDEKNAKRYRYLRKPTSLDEAREVILETFHTLAKGKQAHKNHRDSIPPEYPELKELERKGNIEAQVIVSTGMAVRLPGKGTDIIAIPSQARLAPMKVYDTLSLDEATQEQEFQRLADEVLAVMDTDEKWRSVAGAMDYGDSRIWEILGIEEIILHEDIPAAEPGIYRGMPGESFTKFLVALAQNEVRSATE